MSDESDEILVRQAREKEERESREAAKPDPKAPHRARAKFCVIGKSEQGEYTQISLSAVCDMDPESENGKFFKTTPAGSISLSVKNPAAAEVFKLNQEVYVDFTPVSG